MSVHGTAHFGERAEVAQAGLLGRASGLMIGWWYDGKPPFEPLRYDGDLHQLIVGGVGGGKFTTAIAPMLFGSGLEAETVVVIDPKGEIAQATGPFFQIPFADRPSVHVLDPWDEAKTGSTSVLNFIALLEESNPNYVDDARALADAMVLPSGAENTHWDNAARNFLTAVLLYVALDPRENGQRDLLRVREIVTLPFSMPKAYQGPRQDTLSELLYGSLGSQLAGGAIKRGFRALLNREERELSGILSSVERDTAWIDSPQMAKVLRGDSLDLKAAALGGGKYYIIIPPDFFMTHRYWLRLCVTAFAKAFRRYRPHTPRGASRRWRHIVIDEFANLGEMNFVLTDIAVSRGYDVKYHLVIQDLGQLARAYQQGWESFINNTFQRFFAVSDLFTANYVSGLIGVTTAQGVSSSEGESGSDASSFTSTDGYSEGANIPAGTGFNSETFGKSTSVAQGTTKTQGWSRGQTTTQVQRPLRTPDEVRRLDNDFQYLLIRGQLPTVTWRPPYWEVFPSLPDFSLKEILGTIGRQPVDALEYSKFTRWRKKTQVLAAKQPPSLLALPSPKVKRARRPFRHYVRVAAVAAVVALFLYAWLQLPKTSPQDLALKKVRSEISRMSNTSGPANDFAKTFVDTGQRSAEDVASQTLEKLRTFTSEQRGTALSRLAGYPLSRDLQDAAERTIEFETVEWLRRNEKGLRTRLLRVAGEASAKVVEDAKAKAEAAKIAAVTDSKRRVLAEAERELSSTSDADASAAADKLSAAAPKEIIDAVLTAQNRAISDVISARTWEVRSAVASDADEFSGTAIENIRKRLEQTFRDLGDRVKEQEAAKAAPTAIAPPVQTVVPPPASKKARSPVPSQKVAFAMSRGPTSRDYFIQLVRDNANQCAIGHGEQEKVLMGHLLFFADDKRVWLSIKDLQMTPETKEYGARLTRFLSLPVWSRSDREQVFETVLRALHNNVGFQRQVQEMLDRFYGFDRCPFDVVSETDYVAPNYSDAFPPIGLR